MSKILDLEHLLKEFSLIKENYNKLLLKKTQMENIIKNLKTEIHDSRLQVRSQRNNIDSQRNAVVDLQNAMDKLVEEKKKLLDFKHISQEREQELNDKNMKYKSTIDELNKTMENLKAQHLAKIQQIEKEAVEKVEAVNIDFDMANVHSISRQASLEKEMEMANTLNNQKVTMVVLEYEEKLRRASEQLASLQKELQALKSRNSAGGSIYQKRVHELESKLRLLEQAQLLSHNNPILQQTPVNTNTSDQPQNEMVSTSTTSAGERKTVPKRRKLFSMNQQDDY